MARNFRELYKWMVPGWLSADETDGGRIMYTLALMKDVYLRRVLEGLEARFPTRAGRSTQALTGQDRGIQRGRDETNEHYAARLLRWRAPKGHRVRGSAWALLEQISEYFGGIKAWTIDVKGKRHTREADGSESVEYGYPWNWDGAWTSGQPARRFWEVIEPAPDFPVSAHPSLGSGTLWGGSIAPENEALGHAGITPRDAKAIAGLVKGARAWKPAGTRAEWLVLSLYDRTLGIGPEPDGTWDNWANRDPNFRYWYLR